MKPLKDERSRLKATLPNDLKVSSLDAGAPSTFYRWVKHLFERPGFLYDELWASTFLGLNEIGFEKIKGTFDNARYKGIFNNDDEIRWWSNRLTELLFDAVAPESGEMSWDIGRKLEGISREDFSRCYNCRKTTPAPETVAFLDRESQDKRPMHLGCTILHPSFKRELYFEDVRMMEGE